jgi:hypothetical protein
MYLILNFFAGLADTAGPAAFLLAMGLACIYGAGEDQ